MFITLFVSASVLFFAGCFIVQVTETAKNRRYQQQHQHQKLNQAVKAMYYAEQQLAAQALTIEDLKQQLEALRHDYQAADYQACNYRKQLVKATLEKQQLLADLINATNELESLQQQQKQPVALLTAASEPAKAAADNSLTIRQLKAMASKAKIKNYSRMTKAQLIEHLNR